MTTPAAAPQSLAGGERDVTAALRPPLILRRLDWRFLLPDPEIREVGCIADAGGALVQALRAVAESVLPLDPSAPATGRHPLVVVERADRGSLRRAAAAVAEGGWLYAEFRRSYRHPRGWLAHPARCRRDLRRLGFDRVVASWHRPDFNYTIEIMPFGEPAAGEFTLSRAPVSWKRRVQLAVGRLLLRSGVLPAIVPCFSVVAQKASPSDQPPR